MCVGGRKGGEGGREEGREREREREREKLHGSNRSRGGRNVRGKKEGGKTRSEKARYLYEISCIIIFFLSEEWGIDVGI